MTFTATASNNYRTIPELASEWRVSVPHVHNLIKRGDLHAVRIGKRLIVPKDAAQRFLEMNATASAAA
jgi:excisionase family DNA binding protein